MTHYFLFGTEACRIYFEDLDINEVIEKCGDDFDVFKFEVGGNPTELLHAYSGWGDYCCITKEDYETITNL